MLKGPARRAVRQESLHAHHLQLFRSPCACAAERFDPMSAQAAAAPAARAVGARSKSGRVRITPNLFGVAFGLGGLMGVWQSAYALDLAPRWPSIVLLACTATAWVLVLVAWATPAGRAGRSVQRELTDPVTGPFLGLAPTTLVLIGAGVADLEPSVGRPLVIGGSLGVLLTGGVLTGVWTRLDLRLHDIHPGYYLPTVGGGLVSAYGLARIGEPQWGMVAFGAGLLTWLLIGSVVVLRMLTGPMLPAALVPTVAINLAPPAVAGNAHLALNGGRFDEVAHALLGLTLLLVVVEVTMLPLYRRLAFGAGFWAFTFTYAAVATNLVQWSEHAWGAQGRSASWACIVVITSFITVIAVRSFVSLARGTFLPRVPTEEDLVTGGS